MNTAKKKKISKRTTLVVSFRLVPKHAKRLRAIACRQLMSPATFVRTKIEKFLTSKK